VAGRGLAAVLLLAVAILRTGTPPAAAELLPTDPALVTGALDNGLAYVIRPHGNPPGRVAIWLHVHSGSLNETDATRGIAHYLEHMAFNGSHNFPPGSLIPFFQALGMTFGRDQNAFTGFDQTTYTLTLPDARPETLDKGLLYLSDVAMRLSLQRAEIDSERQIILEEKRTRAGAQQRLTDYIYERLAPGSTFGRRLPIGTDETIGAVGPEDFADYYRRWYVPSNITVIVVGDVAPTVALDGIRRHFASGPGEPRPAARPVGVTPYTATRAIVATDPDLTRGKVSILRIEPPHPPAITVAEWRRNLVEHLGTWMFNRRMQRRLAEGQVPYLEAGAAIRQEASAIRIIAATATGRPEAWRAMLTELGEELQRARLHGFSEAELRLAGTSLVADAEEAARQDGTQPARAHLRRINAAVTRREPILSDAQRLDLLRRLLPGVTAREVSEAFARSFDPTHVTVLVELPSGTGVPTEAEAVAAVRVAVDVTPAPRPEATTAVSLLAAPPSAGLVVEDIEHPASGVYSAWLDNGVRVHHRAMDQRRSEVRVAITLAGGRIEETAADRGSTEAAALAWRRPATRRLSSPQIRDLMADKKVRVGASVEEDTLTLSVDGDAADLEAGLQLAFLLLTEPLVEPAAFAQWRESQLQQIAARKLEPGGVLAEAVAETLYPPGEPRLHPLQAAQVEALALPAVQARLDRLVRTAPIEVAVVGDLSRAQALALVTTYLGSLPGRDRIGDKTLDALRSVPRVVGPVSVARVFPARTPQGLVFDGFYGTDQRNVRDSRLLFLAGRILSTRMTRVIREEKQLVYGIGAGSRPATAYPGHGSFGAQAPTDPSKVQALATAIEAMWADFAGRGPTDDEVQVAKRQVANVLDEQMKAPDFWLGRLATLDYRGVSLDDVMAAPAAYQQFSGEDIREAFGRYWRPESRYRFVVTPAPAPPGSSPPPAASPRP
jgi:zinc protease